MGFDVCIPFGGVRYCLDNASSEFRVGVPGIHVTLGVALVCLLSLIVLLIILRIAVCVVIV